MRTTEMVVQEDCNFGPMWQTGLSYEFGVHVPNRSQGTSMYKQSVIWRTVSFADEFYIIPNHKVMTVQYILEIQLKYCTLRRRVKSIHALGYMLCRAAQLGYIRCPYIPRP